MRLPDAYVERIKAQLGGEADRFLRSCGDPRTHGLRLNPLKLDGSQGPVSERIKDMFGLTPVPWCADGFYYEETERPGKHPYHAAGLYYIQEPSAMSAAELLDPQPGDIVLDLAAAPGGKTTQIAGKLRGDGLLVANEIHPARSKILSENVERFGAANTIVLNAAPDKLADRFPAFFDKIMVDAPCSGEGMFRKDPEAIAEWSPDQVAACAVRQLDILQHAVRMLKPGGTLGYSTCTFAREENEDTIAALLETEPALSLLRSERIWPHLQKGEGHFVAVLRMAGDADEVQRKREPASAGSGARRSGRPQRANTAADALRLFDTFAGEALPGFELPPGEALLFGEQLYWLPQPAGGGISENALAGLKVLRPGLHLASVKKGRVEPAHALALALTPGAAARTVSLPADAPETAAFLHGETLPAPAQMSGWTIVAADGFPLGWGKASGGIVKNHYPKGLRR